MDGQPATLNLAEQGLEARLLAHPGQIDATAWRRLDTGGNPFLRQEFLAALQDSGSVGPETGWQAQLLALYDLGERRQVRALAPLYLKQHSFGEYVFDWAWADAYHRAGLAYYPKLVVAVPFTPATGPRLLIRDDEPAPDRMRRALAQAVLDEARRSGVSSVHWLFLTDEEARKLSGTGWMLREGCQFHWHNGGYRSFDDYLGQFTSRYRKKVKRERRRVAEAGLQMARLRGDEIGDDVWRTFYRFYLDTAWKRGGTPYLTEDFFARLRSTMADQLLMVTARDGKRLVATAFYLLGDDTLYGRYWGGHDGYADLHFECCYYQPIEYCIANGIGRFEAGAQGEHKISRGLMPTPTWSAHWLAHPQFAQAVGRYLDHEQRGIEQYREALAAHGPFHRGANSGAG